MYGAIIALDTGKGLVQLKLKSEGHESKDLCSIVMLSIKDCFTSWRCWGDSLAQWPVIFLRRSTAASCLTLGVLAVRRWCISDGTTWGSFARRFIWSSACLLASLSGIRNWINNSSSDCAMALSSIPWSFSVKMNAAAECGGEKPCGGSWGFWFIYNFEENIVTFYYCGAECWRSFACLHYRECRRHASTWFGTKLNVFFFQNWIFDAYFFKKKKVFAFSWQVKICKK